MTSTFQVRRATLDDIGQLTRLWENMKLPVDELSKRVTEFQVATNSDGTVAGAVGLQMVQRQGLIHSEAFVDFSQADAVRPQLFNRLTSLANNHGLLRFWTLESAPFWQQTGLQKADAEAMKHLPAAWRPLPGTWLTLKLREDVDALLSGEDEIKIFMAAQKEETQKILERARLFKKLATLLAFILLFLVLGGALLLMRHGPISGGR